MSCTQDSYAKVLNKKIGSAMAVFYKGGERWNRSVIAY
jgi:hypothetical protein